MFSSYATSSSHYYIYLKTQGRFTDRTCTWLYVLGTMQASWEHIHLPEEEIHNGSCTDPVIPLHCEGGLICPALHTRACHQWRSSCVPWCRLWISLSPVLMQHLDVFPRCQGSVFLSQFHSLKRHVVLYFCFSIGSVQPPVIGLLLNCVPMVSKVLFFLGFFCAKCTVVAAWWSSW